MSSIGNPDSNAPAATPLPGGETPLQPRCPVGSCVRLAQRPPYLKSADPMPMLRPPDLIDEGETGEVVELRTQELRAVRFRRGTFLLTTTQLHPVDEQAA